ncbi:hypothetical protein JTE90_019836 [Oedothorax gibbosus]|uniref:Uncharacterized protein n=1 Tax=Oedothorax gibbosus TaxID=931172 RepID=A0AAV6V5Z3_9ARAC|nr:hypothetical protein JTE90_019836 [Oedothorax gibbosus]
MFCERKRNSYEIQVYFLQIDDEPNTNNLSATDRMTRTRISPVPRAGNSDTSAQAAPGSANDWSAPEKLHDNDTPNEAEIYDASPFLSLGIIKKQCPVSTNDIRQQSIKKKGEGPKSATLTSRPVTQTPLVNVTHTTFG